MKALHLVGGEKGGVGKSVVARVLCQYLIDHGRSFRAFDADASHPSLVRHYAAQTEAVRLDSFESCDRVLESALEDGTVVVDLPAQSERPLRLWLDDSGVRELAEESELRLVRWHVMDDGKDSLALLRDLTDTSHQASDFVVVRNHGRGRKFDWSDGSSARAAAEGARATFVDLPALHPSTMSKIDRIDASFWAACNNRDAELGPCLNLLERQRVKIWLKRCYDQIGRAHASLAIPRPGERAAVEGMAPLN